MKKNIIGKFTKFGCLWIKGTWKIKITSFKLWQTDFMKVTMISASGVQMREEPKRQGTKEKSNHTKKKVMMQKKMNKKSIRHSEKIK